MDRERWSKWIDPAIAVGGLLSMLVGLLGSFHFRAYLAHEISLVMAVGGAVTLGWVLLPRWRALSSGTTRYAKVLSALRGCAPALMVALATCGVYWYLVIGQMPWHADHPVHLFKAWQLGEKLIPSGRLSGWSHFWWAGYPAETLYPMLADLLVVVVRALSFGLLPWPAAYAYTLLATLLLYHLGIYAVGHRWFGPRVGMVAGLIAVLDRGAAREGGWYWTMANGVWPMALGTAFWFFALERFLAILEKPTCGRVAALGVLQALALLGHPMTLLFSLVVYPLFWFVHLLRSGDKPILPAIWATLGGLVLAAMLASFWYLPFFECSDLVEKVGGTWWSIVELGDQLVSNDLFPGTWNLFTALGIAGAIVAWVQGHGKARELTVVMGLLMMAICATTVAELDLGNVREGFNAVHFRRFTYPLKMLSFLLAGYALAGAVDRRSAGRQHPVVSQSTRRWPRLVLALLAVIVFVPVIESLAHSLHYRLLSDIGQNWPLSDASHSGAFKRANTWFRKNVDDDAPFFRIAYETGGSGHLFYASPVYTHRPAVVISQYTAGSSFSRHFRNSAPSTMRYQLVRYVVTLTDFLEKRRDLELVHKTDGLWIYEVKDFDPAPFEVDGDAEVRLVEFGDERIRLKVEKATRGDRLTLFVTQMDWWQASLDGKPVEIDTVEGNRHVQWLMNVPIDRPGMLEFRYDPPAKASVGIVLAFVALLVVGLLLSGSAIGARFPRLERVMEPLKRILGYASKPAFVSVCVLGGALVAALLLTADKPGDRRISDRLHEGSVQMVDKKGKGEECELAFDRKFRCEGKEERHILFGAKRSGTRHESKLLTGILVRPLTREDLVITLPGVKLGRKLLVQCGSYYFDKGKGTVPVEFRTGDKLIGKASCPARGNWKEHTLDTEPFRGLRTLKLVIRRSPGNKPLLIVDGWVQD